MFKKAIVTGGCGFIGSNLVNRLIKNEIAVLNLDDMRIGANKAYLKDLDPQVEYDFRKVDLADSVSLNEAISNFLPDVIFHLAAESHVDRSIMNPKSFIESNITGTFNLLEILRSKYKQRNLRFIHVSTDEVFGSLELGSEEKFTETSQYKPSNPYSASKAASDHLAKAWHETFGLDIIVTNCSNNYGPRQHKEKLIPKIIFNTLKGKEIPIYGDGLNVRDWLYVEDHVDALIKIAHKGKSGESYLIGGNNQLSNIELANIVLKKLSYKLNEQLFDYNMLITHVDDRVGHDRRYATDSKKLLQELYWRPRISMEQGIDLTIDWYLDFWIGRRDV